MKKLKSFRALGIAAALALSVACFAGLAGCSNQADNPATPPDDGSNAFAQQSAGFSAAMASQMIAGQDNDCISPISLYYALSLLAQGTDGDSQKQLLEVLGASSAEELRTLCNDEMAALISTDDEEDYTFTIANSIWAKKGLGFTKEFNQIAKDYFAAESDNLEFGTPAADQALTDWVSDKTNGLLKPGFQSSPDWMAALINAVYFKDSWMDSFDESSTFDQDFHAASDTVSCQMMHKTVTSEYGTFDDYDAARLNFSNATMTFYLPHEGTQVQSLFADADKAQQVLSSQLGEYGEVAWSLPKFKAEAKYDVADALQKLGVTSAFDPSVEGDFDSMLMRGEGDPDPYVGSVEHGTCIDLNEDGVEAAAYTAIMVKATSMPAQEEPWVFTLDRPFAYSITAADGTLLFIGTVTNPTAQ